MQKKSLSEQRGKDVSKLTKEAQDIKLKISKSLSEIKVSKEKNLKKVKNLRRDLAQILTIIKEKEFLSKVAGKEEEK